MDNSTDIGENKLQIQTEKVQIHPREKFYKKLI